MALNKLLPKLLPLAQPSDLLIILKALDRDSIGHSGDEVASGPSTEPNPAVLRQSPLLLSVRKMLRREEGN